MKMKRTLKRLAAVLMLAAGIMAVSAPAIADEIVQLFDSKSQLIANYPATSLGSIAFAEAPDTIEIDLGDGVKFTMINVKGGVAYALKNYDITWTEGKTKQMKDFWIGKFEVTQGVWKKVMGLQDLPASGAGSNQSAKDENMPIARVSWNDITGDDGFLQRLNAKLPDLKTKYPEIQAAFGSKQFRLPSEWEWEYAAAGGISNKDYNYRYSGTSGTTAEDLNRVAVNSVTTKMNGVAVVGTKLPNALGLYDMSGNVWEWCSGLDYPGYTETPGILRSNGDWDADRRPLRGASWNGTEILDYRVLHRSLNTPDYREYYVGFRLAISDAE